MSLGSGSHGCGSYLPRLSIICTSEGKSSCFCKLIIPLEY